MLVKLRARVAPYLLVAGLVAGSGGAVVVQTFMQTAPIAGATYTPPTPLPDDPIEPTIDSSGAVYRADANNLATDDMPFVVGTSITMSMLYFLVRGFKGALRGRF